MIYAAIDIETTGLNPDYHKIIQFGIVLDDFVTPIDQLPALELFVLPRDDHYGGQAYALQMNAGILLEHSKIRDVVKANSGSRLDWCYEDALTARVYRFLIQHNWDQKGLLCAGKNFGSFDSQFLRLVDGWQETIKPRHRCLDPGSMLYRREDGSRPPGMQECKKRAGLDGKVQHTALADCYDTVAVIRHATNLTEKSLPTQTV